MFAHVDADAFFASVLQRKYPYLKGKPLLALGASGGTCVIAASYEAKQVGVHAGMRTKDARKLVPNAIAMPSDFRATCDASRQLFLLLERFAPECVEKASIDEGYMDLAFLERGSISLNSLNESRTSTSCARECCEIEKPYSMHTLAKNIQSDAHRFLDLPVSIGIAPTKTLAKMGSKHNKPHGICVITHNDIPSFLTQKQVNDIPGIGRKQTPKCHEMGWMTAADFAHAPQSSIKNLFGKIGIELQSELSGIPIYMIQTKPEPPKSISRCRSFLPTKDIDWIYGQLVTHLSYCVTKMRRHGLECNEVSIWLRTRDRRHISAEQKFGCSLAEEGLILPHVKQIFFPLVTSNYQPITQSGLLLFSLTPKNSRQISLFENLKRHDDAVRIQKSMDTIRKQFGRESIHYACNSN